MKGRWHVVAVVIAGVWPGACSCTGSISLKDPTPHVRTDAPAEARRLSRPLELGSHLRLHAMYFTDIVEPDVPIDTFEIVDGDSVDVELVGEGSLDVTTRHEGETTLELRMSGEAGEVTLAVAAADEVRVTPAAWAGVPATVWPAEATMVAGAEALFEREASDTTGRLLTGSPGVTWQAGDDASAVPVEGADHVVRVVAGSTDFRLENADAGIDVAVVEAADVVELRLWDEQRGWIAGDDIVSVSPHHTLSVFVVPVTDDGAWVVGLPDDWAMELEAAEPITAYASRTCTGDLDCPLLFAHIFIPAEAGTHNTATIHLGPLSATLSIVVESPPR